MVELYLHSPKCLHGVLGQIYNYLNLSVEIMIGIITKLTTRIVGCLTLKNWFQNGVRPLPRKEDFLVVLYFFPNGS
jgi:hypothetical protein